MKNPYNEKQKWFMVMDDTDVEFDEPPVLPLETEEDIRREREIMRELGYKYENGQYISDK